MTPVRDVELLLRLAPLTNRPHRIELAQLAVLRAIVLLSPSAMPQSLPRLLV